MAEPTSLDEAAQTLDALIEEIREFQAGPGQDVTLEDTLLLLLNSATDLSGVVRLLVRLAAAADG